jgi:hypothetical protein
MYDPAYNNSCRETMAERVVDKERFSFCEYFVAGSRAGKNASAPSGAQSKLEQLFRKKS